MARVSLSIGLVPSVLTACLDDPPEYSVPKAVPPVIQVDKIDPTTSSVVVVTGPLQTFNVPYRVDDQGFGVTASFFFDIADVNQHIFRNIVDTLDQDSDPTPFAEQQGRSIVYPWYWQQTPVDPGAHTLTMFLTRQNNRVTNDGPKDPAESAQVTWFVDLRDSTTSGSAQ